MADQDYNDVTVAHIALSDGRTNFAYTETERRLAKEVLRHRATLKHLAVWQRKLETDPLGSRDDRMFADVLKRHLRSVP